MPPSITFISGVVSGGAGTLAETLVEGNTTGGTDVVISSGDQINFGGTASTDPAMRFMAAGTIEFVRGDGSGGGTILMGAPTANGTISIQAGRATDGARLVSNSSTNVVTVTDSGIGITGNIGFYGTSPIAKPTVSGATGGNAALQSLVAQLAALGLIVDSTS